MLALLTLLLAFVCPSCARGADALAVKPPRPLYASGAAAAWIRFKANQRRISAGLHAQCRGGTWCDCQCRPGREHG